MTRSEHFVVPGRLGGRHREFVLSSDRRVGAQSRRDLRKAQTRWAHVHWPLMAIAALTAVAFAVLALLFIPSRVAPYVVGALLASPAWWIYTLMLEVGGMASARSGVIAEQWTADELRKFRRRGWMIVNHVMLQYGDVDHALVGPGGFFAVETKFRSNWSDAMPYLESIASSAKESAQQLRLRIGPRGRTVRPLVVLWGPNLNDIFAEHFELQGVTFCPGSRLHDWLAAIPHEVDPNEVAIAFSSLDRYVTKRDTGEIAASGEIPRTISHGLNDV